MKNPPAAPEVSDDKLVAYASNLISGKTAAFKELERLQRDLDLLAPWGEFDRSAIAKLEAKGVYVTLCATPRNIFDQRKKDDAFPADAAVSVIRMDKNMVHYALVSEAPLAEGAFDPVALPEETLSVAKQEYHCLVTLYLCKYICYIVEANIGIGGLSVNHCAAQKHCGCHKHYLFHFLFVLV